MLSKSLGLFLAGICAVVIFTAAPSAAAPMTPIEGPLTVESMVQQIQGGWCQRVRRGCRADWGNGPRYRRCVDRRSNNSCRYTQRRNYCQRQLRRCRIDFGQGRRFRNCMARAGC